MRFTGGRWLEKGHSRFGWGRPHAGGPLPQAHRHGGRRDDGPAQVTNRSSFLYDWEGGGPDASNSACCNSGNKRRIKSRHGSSSTDSSVWLSSRITYSLYRAG